MKSSLVLLGLSLSALSSACLVAYNTQTPMRLAKEKALIVWDEDTKTQSFIRIASFDGLASDVGFVVPTPSEPKVTLAEQNLFRNLDREVAREIANRNRKWRAFESKATAAAGFASDVTVVDQYQVGNYLVTILLAKNGSAMSQWMTQHGYATRPSMTPWLDYYAKKNWHLTALKLTRKSPDIVLQGGAQKPPTEQLASQVLCFTFKTDRPHYPYMMPSDTWPKGHVRDLSLYLIGKHKGRASFEHSGKRWEGEHVITMPIGNRLETIVNRSLHSTRDLEGWTMTAYQNHENINGFGEDLRFDFAPEPPTNGLILAGLTVAGLGVVGFKMRKR